MPARSPVPAALDLRRAPTRPRPWRVAIGALLLALLLAAQAAPAGAQEALPSGVEGAVRAAAAQEANVQPSQVTILRALSVTWSDSCLGVHGPAISCLQALTPGWVVWAEAGDVIHRYHTDDTGSGVVLAASGIAAGSVAAAPPPEGATPRPTGALIEGDLAVEGVNLFTITAGASPALIVEALADRGCEATTVAITRGGDFILYVPGAPDFVNADFPGDFASGAAFFARCTEGEAGGGGGAFSTGAVDRTGREGMGMMVDVRVAAHADFDRIVFEFTSEREGLVLAEGVPSYSVRYTTEPQLTCGAGDAVDVEGAATLTVHFPDTFVYDPDAAELTIPTRHIEENFGVVRDVREICAFEARSEWVIGLTSERGFRVSELSSPTRLVLDIETD